MAKPEIINTSALDELIFGRVEPHIYAFSTETVPNYLKVGDTYRPLEMRLDEWRKHFPNLEKKFSNGKNSPKGTSLFLSYLVIKFNSLFITANEL